MYYIKICIVKNIIWYCRILHVICLLLWGFQLVNKGKLLKIFLKITVGKILFVHNTFTPPALHHGILLLGMKPFCICFNLFWGPMLFSWNPAVLSKCKYVSYHNLLKGQSQKQSLLLYCLIVNQSIVRDYCLLLYENLLGTRNSLTTCQLYESRDTREFIKHQ